MKSSAGTIMLDAAASWHGNDMRLQYDVHAITISFNKKSCKPGKVLGRIIII